MLAREGIGAVAGMPFCTYITSLSVFLAVLQESAMVQEQWLLHGEALNHSSTENYYAISYMEEPQ